MKPKRSEKQWLGEFLNEGGSDALKLVVLAKELDLLGRNLAALCDRETPARVQKTKNALSGLEAAIRDGNRSSLFRSGLRDRYPQEYLPLSDLEGQIEALLRRYASSPELRFDVSSKRWHGGYDAVHGKKAHAIRYLTTLISLEKLSTVRQCLNSECERWFIAMRLKQKCCKTECRKLVESQEPAFKRKRARYMRNKYRPLKKEQKAAEDAAQKRIATKR